jgi:two-component system, OmpR family, phosphate regulon sensor histidine kinase PhoR
MNDRIEVVQSDIHTLWERLSFELAGVLDAHGVCAAAASEIARFTGITTVTSISDPLHKHFDVWICDGGGHMKQDRWPKERAAFDTFIERGQAVLQEKYDLSPGELTKGELWLLPRQSILAVPIPFPGNSNVTLPGAVCLIDPPADSRVNLSNIEPLARHITMYLDRAFLHQRSYQQEVEFGIISDISYSITSTLDLEEIFSKVADSVRRALGAESISIGLTDQATNEIVFVPTLMGQLFRNLPPVRLKMGQGIAGWVAERKTPLIVSEVYSDKRFYSKVDRESGFQTSSILCIPLTIEQRVIGVLEAINKQNGDFNNNDQRLLEAIGGPLAVAIENARLHADVSAEKTRMETIFGSMSEGLLTASRDGRITVSNDAFLTLLRRSDSHLTGELLTEIVRTKPHNFSDFVNRVLQKEPDTQLASDLIQMDGSFVPVLISAATIEQELGEIDEMIFVFSDLRQIREFERMRDDFFHNIIHELRTPLATILMYARLLREGKASDDQAKADRFLGVIERESDRLQKMVRQMLQLAKLEAREIQRSSELISLNAIFDEILPPLADQATEKGLTFSQHVQSNLPPIVGNEDTIYMILKNLVENSVKFTLSGTVKVDARLQNGFICVEVSDEGIGIPEQALPNLFKRFYRTQTAVERGIAGTGLGLYMVQEGIDKHGGTINVTSSEGKGTTFEVLLPVAPDFASESQ